MNVWSNSKSKPITFIFMKKIFAILLCLTAIGPAFAQTPECKTAYETAKKADDTYNKNQQKLVLNPNDDKVNKLGMAEDLMSAYNGYMTVIPMDAQPNAKGEVKPKYTKKIYESLKRHAKNGDFVNAGIEFWNAQKLYPEAYDAFIINAKLVKDPAVMGNDPKIFEDSIVGVWYYNAGNCAFNTQNFEKAAEAYRTSLNMGNTQAEVYKYLIAAYQNMQRNNINDSVYVENIQKEIYDVAEHAYNTFGSSDTYMFNNYMNRFFLSNDYQGGLAILNKEIAANPENGNLYNLRAMFYRELNNNDARVADLLKAGELCNDFPTLTDVAAELYRAGQKVLANNPGDTPESKAIRMNVKTNYFEKALEIANKAKGVSEGRDTNQLDRVIDNINYGLETFF